MKLLHIPWNRETNGRVETGPVQFGEDWPGVFIRGDDAMHFALCLQFIDEPMHKRQAQNYARVLFSCNQNQHVALPEAMKANE